MSKTLEELGYKERGISEDYVLLLEKEDYQIAFLLREREVNKRHRYLDDAGFVTMEELIAINEKCRELGWLDG